MRETIETAQLYGILLEYARAPDNFSLIKYEPEALFVNFDRVIQWALNRFPPELHKLALEIRPAAILFIKRACFTPESTHYQVLCLKPQEELDQSVLRARYRAMIRLTHPDVGVSGLPPNIAARVNQAYSVLSDPQLRRDYRIKFQEELCPAPKKSSMAVRLHGVALQKPSAFRRRVKVFVARHPTFLRLSAATATILAVPLLLIVWIGFDTKTHSLLTGSQSEETSISHEQHIAKNQIVDEGNVGAIRRSNTSIDQSFSTPQLTESTPLSTNQHQTAYTNNARVDPIYSPTINRASSEIYSGTQNSMTQLGTHRSSADKSNPLITDTTSEGTPVTNIEPRMLDYSDYSDEIIDNAQINSTVNHYRQSINETTVTQQGNTRFPNKVKQRYQDITLEENSNPSHNSDFDQDLSSQEIQSILQESPSNQKMIDVMRSVRLDAHHTPPSEVEVSKHLDSSLSNPDLAKSDVLTAKKYLTAIVAQLEYPQNALRLQTHLQARSVGGNLLNSILDISNGGDHLQVKQLHWGEYTDGNSIQLRLLVEVETPSDEIHLFLLKAQFNSSTHSPKLVYLDSKEIE